MNKRKYKRYLTQGFELDNDEKKSVGLSIISERQNRVQVLSEECARIIDEMKKKCPDLNEKLMSFESKLKKQKKHLKVSLDGLKKEPFVVVADVTVQTSNRMGMLEFIEYAAGTGIVLLEEPGLPDQIIDEVSIDETIDE